MKQIKLTQGKFALVDDSDYEKLDKYKWYALRNCRGVFRAVRGFCCSETKKIRSIYMHRQIMSALKGMDVDHINHNTLDNQKHNLRICTRSQNMKNGLSHKDSSSQFKGVFWHSKAQKWEATIWENKKHFYLGCFDNEIEAAKAYDRKAKELFGEFANLNFKENYCE